MSPMFDPDSPMFQLREPARTRPSGFSMFWSAARTVLITVYRLLAGAFLTALVAGALWAAWFIVCILSRAVGLQ